MNEINLSQIDLNLLVALDALLDERSVTRAARRTGVGQSAMSHTLSRLRDLLDDPLFVRAGRSLEPTPRAVALEAPVRRLLRQVHDVLSAQPTFDPATSQRRFTVICPDSLGGILPALLQHFEALAPHVQLHFRWPRRDPAEALADGAADLALTGPHADVSGIVRRGLGDLEWAIAMRADHPCADETFTVERWLQWPHIVVETGNQSANLVGTALERAGHERTVGVVLPSLIMAPFVAARTDQFYAMPRKLAEPLAAGLGLVLRAPPIPMPDVPVVALWPQRIAEDAAHAWFRDTLMTKLLEFF